MSEREFKTIFRSFVCKKLKKNKRSGAFLDNCRASFLKVFFIFQANLKKRLFKKCFYGTFLYLDAFIKIGLFLDPFRPDKKRPEN